MNLCSGLKSLMLSTLFAAALSQVARPRGHTVKQYRNQSITLDGQLTLGERVYRFLEASHGQDYALAYLDKYHQKRRKEGQGCRVTRKGTSKDDLPRGFWHSFVTQEMHLEWTKALQMKASRAFGAYLDKTGSQPTMTRVAARGERKGTSCRSSGGAHNGFIIEKAFV